PIDILGLQAHYANLHTDQGRDYFMQRYHDVISSFVFFSSRRRHTRFSRDWSSDVCSSDLLTAQSRKTRKLQEFSGGHQTSYQPRSEERRVGKECRSRWTTSHKTINIMSLQAAYAKLHTDRER